MSEQPERTSGSSDFPSRDQAVLRYLLDHRAAEDPDKVFAVFDQGPVWTRKEVLARVRSAAASLQRLGVDQGDHVVCWLPNGPEALIFFFAVNYLGGVFVPINTAYRGGVLSHVLSNSDAALMIADSGLVHRLADLEEYGRLRTVITVGAALPDPTAGLTMIRVDDMPDAGDNPAEPERPIEPWDTQAIMYTSGTTGPSKGVLCSYMQAYSSFNSHAMPFITADDRFLINMPFFHVGGSTLTYTMLINGGSVAVVERFSGERFWTQIRETDSTIVFLLGVMAGFVAQRDPTPAEVGNPLTKVFMSPLIDDVDAFTQRFGVDIYTIYNMTELSAPLLSEVNPQQPGTCGRPRPGVHVRLVDEVDREVPVGAVGEIVVRTDQPWALNHGYYKMPEATAAAWRNGWFHTGDSARRDSAGNFYFVDRLKDSIRRRGENISSLEVERELLAHPDIREAAVVAVPSEIAEDEVLAVVAPVPGRSLDPAQLIAFLQPRMAYYMVPRYFRIVHELPKTDTAKIQKAQLRTTGVTPDTWDRETAGIRVAR
ncbi:AMP-binding protein [Nocardia carnea]|uniref:AMP-binding protein n=1 Tax=Nocardia carnea TaxID=37328 RepID=UPI0024575804|nr:AMP-binding protein [Nocardia carnea]